MNRRPGLPPGGSAWEANGAGEAEQASRLLGSATGERGNDRTGRGSTSSVVAVDGCRGGGVEDRYGGPLPAPVSRSLSRLVNRTVLPKHGAIRCQHRARRTSRRPFRCLHGFRPLTA